MFGILFMVIINNMEKQPVFCITDLLLEESVTDGLSSQRTGNSYSVSIAWRHRFGRMDNVNNQKNQPVLYVTDPLLVESFNDNDNDNEKVFIVMKIHN